MKISFSFDTPQVHVLFKPVNETLAHIHLIFHSGERYQYDAYAFYSLLPLTTVGNLERILRLSIHSGCVGDGDFASHGEITMIPENDVEKSYLGGKHQTFYFRDKETLHIYLVKVPFSSSEEFTKNY